MARKNREDTEIRVTAVDATKEAFRSVQAGLNKLDASAKTLGVSLGALGGLLGVGAFTAFTSRSIAAVAALDDLSEKTGLTVEFLSQLDQVATIGGHSLESAAGAASKFAKSVGEAKAGNKELLNAFAAIGVSADDLRSKNLDELFLTFAKRIGTAEDAALAIAAATKLAGKAAAEQIPFFKDLAEQGLRSARVTTEQAAAAEKLQKEFGKLKVEAENLGIALANTLVPPLTDLIARFNRLRALNISDIFGRGLFISGEQLKEPLLAIAEIDGKLVKLKETLKSFEDRNAVVRFFSADDIAILKTQIATLERERKLLSEQAGKGMMPPAPQPESFKIDPSILNDEAAKAEKALAKLTEQRAKAVAEAEKALAQDRLRILEGFYQQGLIGDQEYHDTRLTIQREALGKEVAAINAEIGLRRKAVGDATKGTADYFAALGELEDALVRRNRAEQDFGRFTVDNSLAAARATRDYKDAIAELEAKVADLEGRGADALRIRQDAANRALRTRLSTAGDESGLATLTRLERGTQAQATFNDLREKGATISERLALSEERIQNSMRVGAISEIEALRRTGVERQKAVEQLGEIADALDAAAASSGIEKLKLQAEGFRVELEKLAAQSDLVKEKFDTIGESAFSDFLADAVTDIRNVEDAFKRMTDTIFREVTKLASQDIAKKIMGGAADNGFGFGALMSKIFGGMLGGGGGGQFTNQALALSGFANGGSFLVGGSGGVDDTPVAFRATRGERVTVTQPGQSPGGVNVVNNFHISGPADARSQQQIALQVGRSVNRAIARNG